MTPPFDFMPSLRFARAALVLLFTLSAVSRSWAGDNAPAAPAKTQVKDAKGREQLLGEHRLTLQWITYGSAKPGKVRVTEENGLLKLQGEQRSDNGNYLTVDGLVESVDAKNFVLVGKVEMRVDHINEGKPCLREGRFTFRITGKRRYWRMKEMDNPCDGVTDYVDIFLR